MTERAQTSMSERVRCARSVLCCLCEASKVGPHMSADGDKLYRLHMRHGIHAVLLYMYRSAASMCTGSSRGTARAVPACARTVACILPATPPRSSRRAAHPGSRAALAWRAAQRLPCDARDARLAQRLRGVGGLGGVRAGPGAQVAPPRSGQRGRRDDRDSRSCAPVEVVSKCRCRGAVLASRGFAFAEKPRIFRPPQRPPPTDSRVV